MATCYLVEAAGPRIFRVGGQLAAGFDVATWDAVPAGAQGENSFRSIDVALKVANGYHIGITPTVDGVDLPEQTFNGAGTGEVQCQAFIAERGTRLAARVRTLAVDGDIELHDIATEHLVIRRAP